MTESCLHRAKLIVFLIFLSAGIIIPDKAIAQLREYLLKTGYIEKFTHFIEWPEIQNDNDSTFKIAVIGENKFGHALEEIFNKVRVKNMTAKVTNISSVDEIKNCMILVISGSINMNKLEEILHYTTGKQILTISENKGYGKKGVIINMFVADNYIRYEINRKTLELSGLKISSLLLNSAIIINTNE
jgi:hypothetical protein